LIVTTPADWRATTWVAGWMKASVLVTRLGWTTVPDATAKSLTACS
jgi:hypothetical protein